MFNFSEVEKVNLVGALGRSKFNSSFQKRWEKQEFLCKIGFRQNLGIGVTLQ